MLTCVYHPTDPMRVVEGEEADKLFATGFWFPSPKTAREFRLKVEDDIKKERQVAIEKEEAAHKKTKPKNKGS